MSPEGAATQDAWLSLGPVHVLPTRYGGWFALLTALVLTGAINYGNNLAYGLAFLLAGLWLLAPVHAHRSLRGLRLRAAPPAPCFAGGQLCFPVSLSAPPGRDPGLLWLQAEARPGRDSQAQPADPAALYLRGGGTRVLGVQRSARQRGHQRLGALRVESRCPLGLFRARSTVQCHSSGLVYPRPGGRGALPAAEPDGGGGEGGALGGGEALALEGLRPYRAGDSPRHLAWRQLARSGSLEVKDFRSTARPRRRLDLARTRGTLEQRLSQLCLWVLEAERLHCLYELRLPGLALPPGQGAEQRQRALRALAEFAPPPGPTADAAP